MKTLFIAVTTFHYFCRARFEIEIDLNFRVMLRSYYEITVYRFRLQYVNGLIDHAVTEFLQFRMKLYSLISIVEH